METEKQNLVLKNRIIMKQILFLLIIIATVCKAQIYPFNTKVSDLPPNAYIKDIDGELDKYIGIWVGNWNGKTIYIEMKKVKYYYEDSNYPYYKDMILGERKIVSSNGIVEIDRITNFDYENAEISGIFNSFNQKKKFIFSPENMCNKQITLYIENYTTNQMTLHFEYLPSLYDSSCIHNAYEQQHGDFPINFPKDIILTKQ
ncbi:DUF6705 family protein [Chryseobacterium sp.]|uniref:DUF6705 family protein n=1 Tax=Chryseobacterium sp. TaxID=1871047 RepID=UPI0028971FAE|nr:DUF6705 family protein [Chryseobacterium sp.]